MPFKVTRCHVLEGVERNEWIHPCHLRRGAHVRYERYWQTREVLFQNNVPVLRCGMALPLRNLVTKAWAGTPGLVPFWRSVLALRRFGCGL